MLTEMKICLFSGQSNHKLPPDLCGRNRRTRSSRPRTYEAARMERCSRQEERSAAILNFFILLPNAFTLCLFTVCPFVDHHRAECVYLSILNLFYPDPRRGRAGLGWLVGVQQFF